MSTNPIRLFHDYVMPPWQTTEATVDSCTWVQCHDNLGVPTGHYDVEFSYPCPRSGKTLRGTFCHEGSQWRVPYLPGDKVAIEYKSRNPARCRCAGARSNHEKLEALVVMTLFAIIVAYVLINY